MRQVPSMAAVNTNAMIYKSTIFNLDFGMTAQFQSETRHDLF